MAFQSIYRSNWYYNLQIITMVPKLPLQPSQKLSVSDHTFSDINKIYRFIESTAIQDSWLYLEIAELNGLYYVK